MKLSVRGMEKAERVLQKAEKSIANPNMKDVAQVAYRDVTRHFKNEQGPSGAWEALKHRSGQALRDSGRLFQSIRHDYSKRQAKVSTNVDYAAIHNYGGMAGKDRKAKIPKREFMYLSDKGKKDIVNVVTEHLKK